jgi:hypothetical protein
MMESANNRSEVSGRLSFALKATKANNPPMLKKIIPREK